MNQADLSTITDIKELKAMAYDRICQINQFQAMARQEEQNIQAIEVRITQLSQEASSYNTEDELPSSDTPKED